MIHLFLNGLGASAGGGLTYLNNVIPHLSARNDVRVTAVVREGLRRGLGEFPNVSLLTIENVGNVASRFWQEQSYLPKLIRQSGAEILLSTGNFALRESPVPQILLSRNSLYVSDVFSRDLLRRRNYLLWMDTRIKALFAKRSINWADCTIAPTLAFAEDLRKWTGKNVIDLHHGFDPEKFFNDTSSLSADLKAKLDVRKDALRLLFVSHYNYYRNFETLLRSIPVLRASLPEWPIKLFLTCTLRPNENPGSYCPAQADSLISDLGIRENVVELGAIPHHLLHHVYRACNLYVTPAYSESFAHPLVEAMASGLPIVASDLPVHREICGMAASYFEPLSCEELAHKTASLVRDNSIAHKLSLQGILRSRDFSWRDHVSKLISIAVNLQQQKAAVRGGLR